MSRILLRKISQREGDSNLFPKLALWRSVSLTLAQRDKNNEWQKPLVIFMAEGVKRKLNVDSPTLDNLELREIDPPEIKLLDKLEFTYFLYLSPIRE